MRLFLICFLILAFLLFICVFSTVTVTDITDQTTFLLQEAMELYRSENYMQGYSKILTAQRTWNSQNKTLGILLYHSVIDEISADLAKLNAYALEEDWEEMFSAFAGLLSRLNQLRDMEHPTVKNVL